MYRAVTDKDFSFVSIKRKMRKKSMRNFLTSKAVAAIKVCLDGPSFTWRVTVGR